MGPLTLRYVDAASLSPQWAEYVLFASLLVAVCVIFSIMAHFYTYMDPAEIEAQFRKKDDDHEVRAEKKERKDSRRSQRSSLEMTEGTGSDPKENRM